MTSKTPISSTFRPVALSAFWVAGIGAVSMITGSSAARTAVCTRASGVRPSSAGLVACHHEQRGRAVADLRAVSRVDGAVGLEAGLELGHRLERTAAAHPLVGVDDRAVLELDRGDLPGEPTLVDGGGRLRVRGERVLVELRRVNPQRSAIISAPIPWFGGTSWKTVCRPTQTGRPVGPIEEPIGTRLIDSTPPATTTSYWPLTRPAAAKWTDC